MERNEITIAVLVSAFTLIVIFTCIAPHNSESEEKCMSPPTKTLTKHFYYTIPSTWLAIHPDLVAPLCEEDITIYWKDCAGNWVEIFDGKTDVDGLITYEYIPGDYWFRWEGEGYDPDTCPCCHTDWYHTVTCCSTTLPDNYVNKVKGGDKAFLFFVSTERFCNFRLRLPTLNLNQSLLGERCLGNPH